MNEPTESADGRPPPTAGISRRRMVLYLAGLAALLVGGLLLQKLRGWRGRRLWAWHRPGPPSEKPADVDTLNALVAFTATLHGRTASPADRAILRSRLAEASELDAGWKAEFERAAAWLDRRAREMGEPGFAAAGDGVREDVAREVVTLELSSLRSELRALVSERERTRRMMRRAVVPQLGWIYRHSEVVWRRRGSPGWPRAPHGARAYTEPASLSLC